MKQVRLELPGPLLAIRVGGLLGEDGLDALRRQLTPPPPPGPDPLEELKDQLRAQAEQQRAQVQSAIDALARAAAETRNVRAEIIESAEPQLIELALQIARKVVMQEIADRRVRIEPIVKEALLRLPNRQDVTVHLHPDDWDQCQIARQCDQAEQDQKIRFVSDPSVARGECVVQTREGHVESRVEDHFQAVAEAITDQEPPA
jgi:flagellar assembly protein FliH